MIEMVHVNGREIVMDERHTFQVTNVDEVMQMLEVVNCGSRWLPSPPSIYMNW